MSTGGRRGPKMAGAKKMAGAGIKDILKGAHKLIKSHRVISRALTALGHPKAGEVAHTLGYGRKRKHRIHHRRGAGGIHLGPFGVDW